MVLMEVDKGGKLRHRQIGEGITSIPLDEFFDCLSFMEKDAVWWSFNIKDLVHKGTEALRIWREKE